MAEHDEWTAADDALVRRAMATLRTDVESVPLPDVRFVRARGRARRRHRFLALSAAAAVAVVVAGTAGYAVWGPSSSRTPVTPASSGRTASTTSSASPTTTATDSLAVPGALPLLTEWTSALQLTGTVRLTPVKPFGPIECLSSEPGTKVQQEEVTRAPELQGGATRFRIGAGQDVQTAAAGIAQDIAGCQVQPAYRVTQKSAASTWPRLFSYTAGGAGSGWWVVAPGPHDVTVLQVNQNDRPESSFTQAQVARLAEIATERLARYGSGTTTTTTPAPDVTGPKAIDEQMPVVGPGPLPPSSLFVAASQWSSAALTGGSATDAGPGALEGSTAVASCETDQQQAGIGGRVGVVSIRVGTSASGYVGRQRVQLDDSTGADTQQAYVDARLAEARTLFGAGCSVPNATIRSTPGPTAGTWRLDTVFSDGTPTLSEWVGVTAQKTPGAVSTIVLTRVADPTQGFAELERLLNLARQK
ncbi:hypothetical protein ACFUC1_19245 [Pedococcus sp. NPDC057267]|uniref:hypothetical protein n=1 Tax=Pedococcus sp. NPDC057267 TaxID=3346077 RepID=UPI0036284E79